MPSWVSQHSHPERKLGLLERWLSRLRGAIKTVESPAQIGNAAEKVRTAALAVIKAKRALIREYPQRDPEERQSAFLNDEEQRWLSFSIDAIVEEYGGTNS